MDIKTLPFYEDGPVKVTKEAFAEFANAIQGLSFDQIYYYWLNENFPNDVRRLMIRTLTRQTFGNSNKSPEHYNTDMGIGRLLCIGGKGEDGRKNLYWTLKNRPKLATELIEELCYSLQNRIDYSNPKLTLRKDYYQLIEFLLPIANHTQAEALWVLHPLKQGSLHGADFFEALFRAYNCTASLPDWIRDELWEEIVDWTKCEASFLVEDLPHTKVLASDEICEHQGKSNQYDCFLFHFEEYISVLTFTKSKKATEDLIRCIQLLEGAITKDFNYVYHNRIDSILQRITRPDTIELAMNFSYRHLKNAESYLIKDQEHLHTLYWLLGIATAHHCSNPNIIRLLLSNINTALS